jgi:hypothetical protein
MDPVAARKQYDGADKAVDAEWEKEFGKKPPVGNKPPA